MEPRDNCQGTHPMTLRLRSVRTQVGVQVVVADCSVSDLPRCVKTDCVAVIYSFVLRICFFSNEGKVLGRKLLFSQFVLCNYSSCCCITCLFTALQILSKIFLVFTFSCFRLCEVAVRKTVAVKSCLE